jgi:hypothetical protein
MIQTSAVHVSSAEILDLHNTPKLLTPAPGGSQIVVPVSMLFIYNHVTTAYTNPGDKHLYVSTVAEQDSPNTGYWWLAAYNGLLTEFSFSTMCLNAAAYDDVSVAGALGQALALFTQGPGTAFTLGDGTLDVVTKYYVQTIPIVPT